MVSRLTISTAIIFAPSNFLALSWIRCTAFQISFRRRSFRSAGLPVTFLQHKSYCKFKFANIVLMLAYFNQDIIKSSRICSRICCNCKSTVFEKIIGKLLGLLIFLAVVGDELVSPLHSNIGCLENQIISQHF